jgi:hypothetical protein
MDFNDEYPQRPGISETTIIAAGIHYSDYPEPRSIEIPYCTIEGDITKYSRWRLPSPRANGQRYHQEKGTTVYAYYPPRCFRRTREPNRFGLPSDSIFLVEGEFKALSLLEAGVWAIGIPSFTIYSKDENGTRRLLRDLQFTFGKEKPSALYFLGDSDTASNFEFARNAEFLTSAVNPTKVFLPRIPIDRPKGIDDCKETLGAGFDVFFAEMIRNAIELQRKFKAPAIALMLLERERTALKVLSGVEREKHFDRIVRMCAAAQTYGKSDATSRLCNLAREILGISKTEFRDAVANTRDAAASSDDQSHSDKLETIAIATVENFNAYYDEQKKEYAMEVTTEIYQSRTETQFKRNLRFRGLTGDTIPSRNWSQLDIALRYFQEQKFVNFVGPIAGKKCGFYHENGVRILVTSQARVIEPKKGQWGTLNQLFANLIAHDDEPYAQSQIHCFYGWLKIAFKAFCAHKFQPGQALALAGPIDCGKSLVQSLITEILGGRSAKAALFLQGRTDFNSELFGAEHLILEDEAASTLYRDRLALGTAIKNIIANRMHPCHPKNRQIINLCPWWRLSISLNDRAERLLILPPLTDDIRDKIILLRASKHPMPMPAETADEKQEFWKTLTTEIPAFLHWLINDFIIEDSWRDTRFGIKTFHHPTLMTDLEELSPSFTLLGLIDAAKIWDVGYDVWEGTALELRSILMANNKTAKDATKLLDWINACGQYLNDLAEIRPARVKQFRSHDHRTFEIYRPTPVL